MTQNSKPGSPLGNLIGIIFIIFMINTCAEAEAHKDLVREQGRFQPTRP